MKNNLVWPICLLCLLAACAPAPSPAQAEPTAQVEPEPSRMTVEVERSYVLLSFEQMVDQADTIFLGQVQHISPTRWNQDSGEYWQETIDEGNGLQTTFTAVPYYEVQFSVERSILGAPIGPLTVTSGSDLQIQKGDRLIVFVHHGLLPWRKAGEPGRLVESPAGRTLDMDQRPVVTFYQEPMSSLFYQGPDGLYHSLEDASQQVKPFSLEELERLVGARKATDGARKEE